MVTSLWRREDLGARDSRPAWFPGGLASGGRTCPPYPGRWVTRAKSGPGDPRGQERDVIVGAQPPPPVDQVEGGRVLWILAGDIRPNPDAVGRPHRRE